MVAAFNKDTKVNAELVSEVGVWKITASVLAVIAYGGLPERHWRHSQSSALNLDMWNVHMYVLVWYGTLLYQYLCR